MMDMESVDMCDVKKYYNIYDELKKLKPEDTLQLVMEAENLKCLETICFRKNKIR